MNTIDLALTELDINIVNLLGHDYAMEYEALPINLKNRHLRVAIDHTRHDIPSLIRNLVDITHLYIVPVHAPADEIRFHINRVYGEKAMSSLASQFVVDQQLKLRTEELDSDTVKLISNAPAVRLLESVISAGVLHRASDIHIEPHGHTLRTRYRIDGQLLTHGTVDLSLLPNIISRLKVMAAMDIAEKRRPQDGHFTMVVSGERVDFRLSTLPTAFGEKAALRLLFGSAARLKKEDLGFLKEDLIKLNTLFSQPHGAIFMTGPTGSGKSTTLNCFLESMDKEAKNIVTVEDPVENPIMGVNHVNVERSAGMDFAGALRHILRQDPDVIMVGEIRDHETASIAIRAAITGHVVLSTLHTNDAAGVIERLIDMGIEPYLATAALTGIISQRLVRRICTECSRPTVLKESHAIMLDIPIDTIVYEGAGCVRCNETGYKGRFAIYEYIILDEEKRKIINKKPSSFAEKQRKKKALRNNAIRNLILGNTTVEEVINALGSGYDE